MAGLPDPEPLRARVTDLALALPEAEASSRTGQHSVFSVRGKKFAYFLFDHHGDGRTAITVRGALGVKEELVEAFPERFFVPAYLGPRGWVGLDLLAPGVDWDEVEELVRESYCLAAPKRLAAAAAA